jgi:hypothetical protein
MTSLGRRSAVFGNASGGSGYVHQFRPEAIPNLPRKTLIPPRGYSIAGVTGSCADWVDGFGILITR